MQKRLSWSGALLSALLLVLLGGPAAATEAAPFKPSRKDLQAFYSPLVLDGTSWYGRVGAARWRGERLKQTEEYERLILQLRILGPLDGAT